MTEKVLVNRQLSQTSEVSNKHAVRRMTCNNPINLDYARGTDIQKMYCIRVVHVVLISRRCTVYV